MNKLEYWATALLGCLSIAPAAHAQATAAGAATLDEVVVTTQRRAENTIDVPIALSAYSGPALARLGVQDLHTLSALTPGLLVQDKSALDSRFVMRGIGSDDGSSYEEPRVSVFLDGAPMSKSRGAYVELFDLERVEVARGPQTTLFGQAALTGAINIVQNKADPKALDYSLGVEAGGLGDRRVTAMANLPLGDAVAIRVAGQYRNRDGYVTNVLGGEDFGGQTVEAARVALAFRPTDAFSADVILNHEHDRGTGQPYKSGTFYPADPVTGQVLGGLEPEGTAALAAAPGFEGGRPLGYNRDLTGITALGTWRPSKALSISSTTAWRRFKGFQTLDYDGFAFPLLTVGDDTVGEQISQELRANIQPSAHLDIVAGLSAAREQGRQRTPLEIDEPLVLSLLLGGLNRTNPTLSPLSIYVDPAVQQTLLRRLALSKGVTLTANQASGIATNLIAGSNHLETYADFATNSAYDAFADVSWSVTEKLKLLAGARYAYSDKETGLSASLPNGRSVLASFIAALGLTEPTRTGLLSALSAPGAATAVSPLPLVGLRVQPTANNGSTQSQSLDDQGPAYRLAAHYALSDEAGAYVTYARGRRPEVLAPTIPAKPLGPVTFDDVAAETVDSYEIGLKLRPASRRYSLDAAIYTYAYDHFQTVVQQGAQYVTADAGKASSTGLETEASVFVLDRTRLFVDYTWSHARFREGLYKGNRLALSPDHAVTVGLQADHELWGGTVTFLPTYRYTSKVYFTDDNANPALVTGAFVAPLSFAGSQKGYGVADLRLEYAAADARWTAGVFATNVFDQHYVKEAGNGGEDFGLPTYIAGDPRVVGVSLGFRR